MRLAHLILFLLCLPAAASVTFSNATLVFATPEPPEPPDELIPAERLTDWVPGVTVGVPGGIPTDRVVFTNMTEIDNTGETDVRAAIQGAINDCPAFQVVALPEGIFRIDGALNLVHGRTLRGAGMNLTHITNSGGFVNAADNSYHRIYQEGEYLSQTVTGGLTKGSTNVWVTNTTAYSVGKLALIAQYISTNQLDNPLVTGTGERTNQYNYLYRVLVRITSIGTTNMNFWPPLPGDMSARHARIAAASWEYHSLGLEDFSLHLTGGTTFGIQLGGFRDSWVKGVRVRGASNYSLSLYDSAFMEVRDCSLEDLDHGGSNGAGLLMNTVCASLVENNIIINSFPCIEVNAGSCGNVFAYNFLRNTNLMEIDSNHGPHNAYNLYEGNIAARFISDGYFGSESQGTVYRNWISGQTIGDTAIGYCFALKRFTRDYSLVGNILGSPAPFTMSYDGTSFGQPNIGNGDYDGFAPPWADWEIPAGVSGFQELDTNVLATLVRKGNYNYFDDDIPASESLGGAVLESSLYRTNKPSYFGDLTWPPFNPLSPSPAFTNIPAGWRYMYGTNPPSAP